MGLARSVALPAGTMTQPELLNVVKDGWFEEIQQMWIGKYLCGGCVRCVPMGSSAVSFRDHTRYKYELSSKH
jgi:hypothetical protein